jgi:hypothetical protein
MVAAATPGPSVWSSSMRWAPQHLSHAPVCLVAPWRAGTQALGCHATGARTSRSWREHEHEGDGAVLGGRRRYDQGGVRSLSGAGVGALASAEAGRIVMDNLSSHSKALGCASSSRREGANSSTCLPTRPISIPSKKPSLKALKALLVRRAGARTREALLEVMGRALEAVTANDARGFFEHRGYHATAQLL